MVATIEPVHYKIIIIPDADKMVFLGREDIDLRISDAVDSITLDSKHLRIKKIVLKEGDKSLKCRFHTSEKEGKLTIKMKNKVKGEASLHIEFLGRNNDKGYGFYASRYKLNGREETLLTTQLEPVYARYFFPCFDEPKFKSKFELSVEIDEKLDAVSNMGIVSKGKTRNGKKIVKFAITPPMTTYLLYLGVGTFEKKEVYANNTRIRLVSTPGKTDLANIALKYAPLLLDYFERYFDVGYPLEKLDLIAIPDFQAGAMENWGAITFREELLLAADDCSPKTKIRIIETIAHELAHQWFGNLVTANDWRDIWLNESFATFMSYKAMESIDHSLLGEEAFLQDRYSPALVYDSIDNTHPISFEAKNPIEIMERFDIITYNKGSSILRMLENFVGSRNFRNGLSEYIKINSYTSVGKEKFWSAIENNRDKSKEGSIQAIMNDWIEKKGYPVIIAAQGKGGIELRQRVFSMDGPRGEGDWHVPIVTNIGGAHTILLHNEPLRIKEGTGGELNLNIGQTGFYRISYDNNLLNRAIKSIESSNADSRAVFGLENDVFYLLRAGMVDLKDYLKLVKAIPFNSYPAVSNAMDNVSRLESLNAGRNVEVSTTAILKNISRRIIDAYGLEKRGEDSEKIQILREKAINSLGFHGDEKIIEYSVDSIERYLEGTGKIENGAKNGIFRVSAWANGDKEFLNKMEWIYENSDNPEERMCALAAMGSFSDKNLLVSALDYSLSKSVRIGEKFLLLNWVAINRKGTKIIWPWIRKNWNKLKRLFPPESEFLKKYLVALSAVSDKESMLEIKNFFRDKRNLRKDIVTDLNSTLEFIENNVSLSNRLTNL